VPQPVQSAMPWSAETLKSMLRRENELRLSPETQKLYESAEKRNDTDWMEVTATLQERVLREFGVAEEDMARGLYTLRTSNQIFPDDPEMKEIPLYVKYNIARQGSLNVGDSATDVPLTTLDNQTVSLLQYCKPNRPLVIIGASYS